MGLFNRGARDPYEENYKLIEDYMREYPRMYDGRKMVVCGATHEPGGSAAEWLAGSGAETILTAPDGDALNAIATRLGGATHALPVDAMTPSGTTEIVRAVGTRFSRADGLLINPPVAKAMAIVLEAEDRQWRDLLEALVVGPARLMRAMTPSMTDASRVVMIVSETARRPAEGDDQRSVVYPAAAAMIERIARLLQPLILVNGLVQPGPSELLDPDEQSRIGLAACYLLSDLCCVSGGLYSVQEGMLSALR